MKNTIILMLFAVVLMLPGATRAGEKITGSSHRINPIAVGDQLPQLKLTSTDHQAVDIYSYLKTQPLILIYYRGGW